MRGFATRCCCTAADPFMKPGRTLNFQWKAHQAANKQFADVVFQHYQEGDMVWVQDYHLMLLPALLKNRKPKMKVEPLDALRLCI